MRLGEIKIGSPLLVDLNRDGKRCVTGKVDGVVDNATVSTDLFLDADTCVKARPIVECTNAEDGHVYCYRSAMLGLTANGVCVSSAEDADFHTTRQERRFSFRSHCQLKIGTRYTNDSAINDVSLSGMSLTIPKRHNVAVGQVIDIIVRYTDNSKHELSLEVKRVSDAGSDKSLCGCVVLSGGEFNKLIIEKLKFA